MTTEVIFRKYRTAPYEVFAVFPYIIENTSGDIMAYQHIGQHGTSDRFFSEFSVPCRDEEEYKPLLNELISIGYDDLKIMQKVNGDRYTKAVEEFRQDNYCRF